MRQENSVFERVGLAAAVEQATDGIVITDANGRIEFVNPAFSAMTGYTNEEAVGQNPRILKSNRQSAAFYEEMWSTLRQGRVWRGDVINRRKDGTLYHEEMRITPVRGSDGEIASYIAIKHDVTGQRAAEEAQRFLAAIVDSSQDAIVAYSPAGIILTWNRGAELISGYSSEEAIGKPMSMLVAPEMGARLAEATEQVMQGKSVSIHEGVCLRKDGRRVPLSVTASPIRNSAGEVVAIADIVRDASECCAAEQTRGLLASIVECSDDAIHCVSLDGTIVSWNRGAEVLFGYTSEEIIGKNAAILAPAGRCEEPREYLEKTRMGLATTPFDTVLRAKDGRSIDVLLSISPIRNPAGELVGAAGIARSIGKRVRAERQLRESAERFRGVFEHAPFGMCVAGLDERFIQVNTAFCRMLGYSEKELLDTPWMDLMHLDEVEIALRRKAQLWKGLIEHVETETRYIHRNGNVVWGRVRISVVRDSGGNPLYSVAHVEDITERKRTEEALQESEDRFRSMANGCPTMMWVTDGGGETQFVNRAYLEFCNVAFEQVAKAKWLELVHPDDAAEYFRAFQNAVRGHMPFHADVRIRRADGEWRWIASCAEPRFSGSGEFLGHVGFCPDITERKQAEETKALLASIVECSEEAIVGAEIDGTIVSWNRGAEVLYGYSSLEITGKNTDVLFPSDLQDEFRQFREVLLSGRAVNSFETVRQKKDGTRIDVSLSISSIRNSAGEIAGVSAISRDIGKRVRSERKLRESEERFRGVFEEAPFGMSVAGPDGRLIQVNTAFCRMLGFSEQELLDTPWIQLVHPDDLGAALGRKDQLWNSPGGCVDAELRYIHRSGDVVWVRLKVSLVRDLDGRPQYSVTHVEDISERKRTAEALHESEDRFRVMADGCPSIMWLTDAKGEVEFINRAYKQFCGVTQQHVVQGKWQELLHPDDLPEYVRAFEGAVRERRPFSAEARVRCVDGEWRWFASYAGPRFSPSGEFLGHVGLCPDITERKRAEEELRSSEEKFRQLAEHIRQVFWIMSPSGDEVLYVSPAFEQIWGRSCESVYQNPLALAEAIHPDDLVRISSEFAKQVQGEYVEKEYRIRTPDGQEKWIRDQAFPIKDQRGQLIRVVGLGEDITERKRHEQALIRAREGAEAADRAKSCFLANMSHEIRTPMNGVIGMVELLFETDLTSEQRRYADVAQTSGETLLALIDQILDLSKIESHKISLEKVRFNPCDIVEDVVSPLRVQASAKGLRIHWCAAPEVPAQLRGDPHRLRQVLNHLSANAIKFTGRGEVALDVALARLEESTATLRFTIDDTGIGIRPEQIETIFSPFTQADNSSTRKYGGTGLGLSISKQLVEMMGGTISVTSREGQGSTFSFTAVFELAHSSQQQPDEQREERSRAVGAAGRTTRIESDARILLVEDNSTNTEVALAQLLKLGYKATAVVNGAEAVEAVEHGSYELVLMDCEMPVMDGFEATRRIRQSAHPGIPIVALTADAMSGDRYRCLADGMNDYLSKPVELDRLREKLARWIRHGPNSPPTEQASRPAPAGHGAEFGTCPLEPHQHR